jgi:hypothetical protein
MTWGPSYAKTRSAVTEELSASYQIQFSHVASTLLIYSPRMLSHMTDYTDMARHKYGATSHSYENVNGVLLELLCQFILQSGSLKVRILLAKLQL